MINNVLQKGHSILSEFVPRSKELVDLQNDLQLYSVDRSNLEELYSWFVCVVALQASNRENFGVGAALVNERGVLVDYAENAVFTPYFRSDGHAEMMVLNRFEKNNDKNISTKQLTLYTSLESCPMCLTRAINAHMKKVLHVADDDVGGMTRKRLLLPGIWQELQQKMEFRKTNCGNGLSEIALNIFLSNAKELNEKLAKR